MSQIDYLFAFISSLPVCNQQMLSEDEDMALVNLTKLKDKPSLYTFPLEPAILDLHPRVSRSRGERDVCEGFFFRR